MLWNNSLPVEVDAPRRAVRGSPLARLFGRDERGTAAVEFAILLPFLVLIVLGAIDFGRFAYSAITVTNAVRAGASFCLYKEASACNSAIESNVKGDVIAQASPYLTISGTQVTVTYPTCPTPPGGTCLKVTVAYPFSTLLPIPSPDASGAWVWDKKTLTIVRDVQMKADINN